MEEGKKLAATIGKLEQVNKKYKKSNQQYIEEVKLKNNGKNLGLNEKIDELNKSIKQLTSDNLLLTKNIKELEINASKLAEVQERVNSQFQMQLTIVTNENSDLKYKNQNIDIENQKIMSRLKEFENDLESYKNQYIGNEKV